MHRTTCKVKRLVPKKLLILHKFHERKLITGEGDDTSERKCRLEVAVLDAETPIRAF